jgi:putative transposase
LQLYGVTQRGNQGQWVYRDDDDFRQAVGLMAKCTKRYEVKIHGWCLMHNHAHWIFEASTAESISNVMRDMQGRYSYYLNRKYRRTSWLLLGPLDRNLDRASYSDYRQAGPVNWAPRFDAEFLDGAGFKAFLRYLELNPVRAKLVRRAEAWRWSSAAAHLAGVDDSGLLSLERWSTVFGDPAMAAVRWREYVEGPGEEARANARRGWRSTGSAWNRPMGWVTPAVLGAG